MGIKFNKEEGIISNSYLTTARKQRGFYREIFDVFRFHIKTRVLTHSYTYYLHPEDFNKNFNNDMFVPYNFPFLFALIEKEPPEGYVRIGWDKTRWQCYNISYFKYWSFKIKEFFIRTIIGGIT